MRDSDLIDCLGGPAAVARRLPGVKRGAVIMWKRRGIPARYWRAMEALAREIGAPWSPTAPAAAPPAERAA